MSLKLLMLSSGLVTSETEVVVVVGGEEDGLCPISKGFTSVGSEALELLLFVGEGAEVGVKLTPGGRNPSGSFGRWADKPANNDWKDAGL